MTKYNKVRDREESKKTEEEEEEPFDTHSRGLELLLLLRT